VPGENGIRRSKDLRAEIGKFPNSTNERKQMSKMTLRKRIALVAVSSMGFSLLSITAANATTVDSGEVSTSSVVATTPGLCYKKTTAGSQSVTAVAGSEFVLTYTDGASDTDDLYIAVTGNATIKSAGDSFEAVSLTETTNTNATSTQTVTIKVGSVGTAKITIATNATSAAVEAIAVTIVASCAGDAYAASKSYFTAVNSTEAANGSWTETVLDTSGVTRLTDDGLGYVKIRLNDSYGVNLSTTGALVATATGANCVVGLVAYNGSKVAGKSASAVLSTAGVDDVAVVEQATAGTPASCLLSVTFNGTVVGTKTFTFEGAAAKITVSDVTAGSTTADTGLYRVSVTDAAGNSLSGQVIDFLSTEANNAAALASGVISSPQASTGAVTLSSSDAAIDGKTKAVAYADRTDNDMTSYTCAKEGTAKITVRTTVDTISYITSAPFDVVCGGALDTWSVSMDKASYAPGEIATLTLTGKTAKGNPVATFTFLSGVEYSFGGMTAITAPTNNDAFSSGLGTKTYKFSVGTTEGAFVGSFKTTGTTDDSAKTVQYKVASSTATVSNADVLKSIVALIASINKQIQALQKLILKR
jgi:hypothetical protein